MKNEILIAAAFKARESSYSPYSNYRVGAAILTSAGKIYTGSNVENASYGGSICAERSAAVKAVNDGERCFTAVAVAGALSGSESGDYSYPCGICRQFLREFAAPDMRILVAKTRDDVLDISLEQLLPYSFGPDNLSS